MRLKFGFLLVICALLGMSGCGKSKNGVTVDQAYMASFRPNHKVPWNHGVATAPKSSC